MAEVGEGGGGRCRRRPYGGLKEGDKLGNAQPCLTDNRTKGTGSQFFVVRDREGGRRVGTAQNDMAACVTGGEKADFLQCFDTVTP